MKTIVIILLNTLTLISISFAEQPNVFDGNLALIEVVSVEKLDPSQAKGYVINTDLVHNPIARVIEVYDGAVDLINKSFPFTPPPYLTGEPNMLTHSDLGFDGVVPAKNFSVGDRAVLTLYYRKDFDIMKKHYNPYNFPDKSVFFTLHAPGFAFEKAWPDRFKRRLEWAEAIKRFNSINDDAERITYLKQSIQNDNPLLAVTAVHLLKRFYPTKAIDHFDKIIFAPGTPVYARLAIDHEFCLSRGQTWVNGKQKELEPILEKEAPEVPEGKGLLSFRKQMIDNVSWFGGPGERIKSPY